jgi:SAM-dependent methyltransferase
MKTMKDSSPQPLTRHQPCDLCGGHLFEVVGQTDRRGDFLTSVVCRQCGLVSHGKIPTDDELDVYYGKHYRRDYHGETAPSSHRVIRAWKNGQRLLRRLGPYARPEDRVFEVGAGIGCTVKAFELAGYDSAGIEPNEGFSLFSRDCLRAPVRTGALADVDEHPAYDLVLLIHVIEHFNRPSKWLRKIHRILQPGGKLYVECPNIAAPHAAPGNLFHFAHIYNFTPPTLAMLAGACGFEVEQWFSAERDKELHVLLRRVEREHLEIDSHSYAATMQALRRYNGLTYHLRPSYIVDRVCRLATHWSEHVFSRRRVGRIVARCTGAASPAAATDDLPGQTRKAA